jgi:hypothetical protein
MHRSKETGYLDTPKKRPEASKPSIYIFFLQPRYSQYDQSKYRCVPIHGHVVRRVQHLETNFLFSLRGIEAVVLCDWCDLFWLGEGDIDALYFCQRLHTHPTHLSTHVVKRRAMLRQLNDLDSRIVSNFRVVAGGQWYLRHAKCAVVLVI